MRNAGETETEFQRRQRYEEVARTWAEWRASWTDEELEIIRSLKNQGVNVTSTYENLDIFLQI